MKLSTRLRAVFAMGAVLALAAACSSNSADGPTSTPVVSLTVSPSVVDPSTAPPVESTSSNPSPSVIEPSTPSPASSEISPQEAADRAAIEAQWAEFWRVYEGIVRTPAVERSTLLDEVSVDPAKTRVLDAAARFDADGLDYYGKVVLRPFKIDLDTGTGQAVLSDCQDQSNYGSVYVSTGQKRTVGVDHNHAQAGFVRGADGIWRVQNVQYPDNVPC